LGDSISNANDSDVVCIISAYSVMVCMLAEHHTMTTVLQCYRPSMIHFILIYLTNVLLIFHR